ncbi:Methyltransferase domain-containing protein [Chitinophaga rupis]|uniref:Methyltransferase domain-containing protein n=2 Tax=Chitinophaga rupis TaxID=573321 RepID=A0A1H7ZTU8_9BACT|nr:Methyltransferase domain-containing protein [Chitinophaga rupis]
MDERKKHWEQVYQTKSPGQVSWTQAVPQTSLDFIKDTAVSKNARIIDIGGGDSKLVDFLISEGYEQLTVLDISEKALERAKSRLGKDASKVNWIVSDIVEFKPKETYDLWHDRATFHFLTTPAQISAYLELAGKSVRQYLIVGTFSNGGPEKCSGLPIRQYSEAALQQTLAKDFQKIKCITEDHVTPFDTVQNFTFCSFKKANTVHI